MTTVTNGLTLSIPKPHTLIGPGFGETVMTWADQRESLSEVDETRLRVAALRAYVKRRDGYQEIEAAERWCEVRIGELLPPPVVGSHHSVATEGAELSADERYEFRLMAGHRGIVASAIALGRTSRASILAMIVEMLSSGKALELGSLDRPRVCLGEATEWLAQLEPVDLILTDPPYSTDVDDIVAFAESWLPLALSKLKPTGRAYVFVGAYPAELLAYLRCALPAQVLVWSYPDTLGPNTGRDYLLNWQAILYYRGPEAPDLLGDRLTEKQAVVRHEMNFEGRRHLWQKPMDIGRMFVRQSCPIGGLVADPFAGTGTFVRAAALEKRRSMGCERDPEMLAICRERGADVD